MSVTLAPDYALRKVDPAPHKCGGCGALVWIHYVHYARGASDCTHCGYEPYDVDFYPCEFEKEFIHMGYGTLRNILDRIDVPFDYSGEVSTALVRSRLPRLEGHFYYQLMVDVVESAEQHGVDLYWA